MLMHTGRDSNHESIHFAELIKNLIGQHTILEPQSRNACSSRSPLYRTSSQAVTQNPLNCAGQREALQVQVAAEASNGCRLPFSQRGSDDGTGHLYEANCQSFIWIFLFKSQNSMPLMA